MSVRRLVLHKPSGGLVGMFDAAESLDAFKMTNGQPAWVCARRSWVTEVPRVVGCPRDEAQRSRTCLSAGVLTWGPGNLQQGHGG